MNKRGKETVLTAYIILITIALVGGLLTYTASTPTAAVISDTSNPVITINSFDAVFDPDGVTSFKLAASAKENFNTGLTGTFALSLVTAGKTAVFEGFIFFDGVFGEIKSMKITNPYGEFDAEDVAGTVVVTNAIDGTANVLVKVDFERPMPGTFFEPPSKLLLNFDFTTYDKTYKSKVLPIRYADKPNPFPYYLTKFKIVEIKV
ncbi:LPS export ABC transporter periplasmic protein LptC [Candidatus Woesearchaeota archaeon]|nr:LPS export ABC transporter periplasmic protein LptC [Candidatus Woesearchaeota archaeon]